MVSFADQDISWGNPKNFKGYEGELAAEADLIPTLEHPELPDSRWIDESTRETWYQAYSNSAEALERVIREQARYPPCLFVHIIGRHLVTRQDLEFGYESSPNEYQPRGIFGERRPVSRGSAEPKLVFTKKEITDEEQDFNIQIDMTYLLAQLPSASVPPSPRFKIPAHLRPQLQAVEDGTDARRGGLVPWARRYPDSRSYRPGEDALKFWTRLYATRDKYFGRKRFVVTRKVTQFDAKRLQERIEGLIRSTNYKGGISIKFEVTKKTLVVTTAGRFYNFLHRNSPFYNFPPWTFSAAVKSLIWAFWWIITIGGVFVLNSWTSNMEQSLDIVDVTGIVLLIGWLFWWPIIYYIRRDFQVLYAEFPFGSDLKNPRNPNVLSTRGNYVSGSRITQRKQASLVAPEVQFHTDWANAIRRGVRERYRGVLDTFYLQESNDLYEGYDEPTVVSGRDEMTGFRKVPRRRRPIDVRGGNEKPWGGDEEEGMFWEREKF